MSPRYRFTLGPYSTGGGSAGAQVKSEPIGWTDMEVTLERHPEFHSLVESFNVPLEFYGSDGVRDGGYGLIKTAMTTDPNYENKLPILIEIQPNEDEAFEDLFEGQLLVHEHRDFPYLKKIQVPIVRTDLWSKFISRRSVPINLKSTTGVDEGALTARNEFTLPLPSQIIKQRFRGEIATETQYIVTANGYGIIDFEKLQYNEIEEKHNYGRVFTTTRPFELITAKFGGDYQIDLVITITKDTGIDQVNNVEVHIQINDDAVAVATKTQQGTNGIDGTTKFEYSAAHTIEKNDLIRIYFRNTGGANDFIILAQHSTDVTYLEVVADTVDTDSSTPAYLLHDAALSIVDRIIGTNDSFYSEYFGGGATAIPYDQDGCGYPHAITKGIHVRGYAIGSKPFAMSFDDWWAGVNPMFGLGLGYEIVGSDEVIRVEKLEDFYDGSSASVTLGDVDGETIESSIDVSLAFKNVKIGHTKWSNKSASGIDDHQTVHEYNTKMRLIGEDKDLLSKFYAASLGIEQVRRDRYDGSRDYPLDEDIMVIHMDMTSTPEQPATYDDGDFTGLNNGGSRYNVRLDPRMAMYRWLPFFRIGTELAASGEYKFVKGEGNTAMVFTSPTENDCETSIDSDANFTETSPDSEPIHSGIVYSFRHPLSWEQYKTIRDNRKKKIEFKYIDRDGAEQTIGAFIKKLNFAINKGMATFEVWKA